MDMEQRILCHGIQFPVEFLVIFFLQFGWFTCPQRIGVIDDIIFFGIDIFSIFPFFLLSENNLYREEFTILRQ